MKTPKTYAELIQTITNKRIIYLNKSVDQWSCNELQLTLEYLNGVSSKPIKLYINSYGGSVDSGMCIYDAIKQSKSPIYTYVYGCAASMAAVLLAAGAKGHRVASKHSRIMIHQPSSGFIGKSTEMELYTKEIIKMRELLNKLLADDTKRPLKQVVKDMEKDYWMNAEEAKTYGIVDKVI